MFSENGCHVVETEESTDDEEQERDEVEAERPGLVEVRQKVPAKSDAKAPAEGASTIQCAYILPRSDGGPALREGENRHRKAYRAGREAMIAGCARVLTFQAIIIWRDELNGTKSFCVILSISKRPMRAPTPGDPGDGRS